MTGNSLLLDTNAFIAWIKGDLEIASVIQRGGAPALSVISMGQLLAGAIKSQRAEKNLAEFRKRFEAFKILTLDIETAEHYARISHHLCSLGKPIPVKDLWIAALRIQHGIALVSRDRHFSHIPERSLFSW